MQRRLVHGGDQKLVVGAERDAEMRAGPFQQLRRRGHVRKPQRHAVVMRDREPQALRRERKPADGRGHLERFLLALAARARTRSCRPTTPPRRRDAARHCRSSAAWGRSRERRLSPFASSATTLPSSPPMTMRAAIGGRAQNAAAVHGDRRHLASRVTSATFSSAPTKAALSPRKCTAVDRRADATGRTRSVTETMEPELSARIEFFHHVVMQLSKPSRIICSGNSRPMKTRRLSRCSPSFQSRWWSPSSIMCTPWNT